MIRQYLGLDQPIGKAGSLEWGDPRVYSRFQDRRSFNLCASFQPDMNSHIAELVQDSGNPFGFFQSQSFGN